MNSATSAGHADEAWEAPQLVWLSSQERIAGGTEEAVSENNLSNAPSGPN